MDNTSIFKTKTLEFQSLGETMEAEVEQTDWHRNTEMKLALGVEGGTLSTLGTQRIRARVIDDVIVECRDLSAADKMRGPSRGKYEYRATRITPGDSTSRLAERYMQLRALLQNRDMPVTIAQLQLFESLSTILIHHAEEVGRELLNAIRYDEPESAARAVLHIPVGNSSKEVDALREEVAELRAKLEEKESEESENVGRLQAQLEEAGRTMDTLRTAVQMHSNAELELRKELEQHTAAIEEYKRTINAQRTRFEVLASKHQKAEELVAKYQRAKSNPQEQIDLINEITNAVFSPDLNDEDARTYISESLSAYAMGATREELAAAQTPYVETPRDMCDHPENRLVLVIGGDPTQEQKNELARSLRKKFGASREWRTCHATRARSQLKGMDLSRFCLVVLLRPFMGEYYSQVKDSVTRIGGPPVVTITERITNSGRLASAIGEHL